MKMTKKTRIICTMLLMVFCLITNKTYATGETVRVAFLPGMYGFYEIKENGDYTGYNYEYLMNVAQHTGWKYEFVIIEESTVSASLARAEEMMELGEIDLVGPYSATSIRFDDFETGQKNYGVYRYNFYSSMHNYEMTEDNYFLKDKLSVALVEYYTDLNDTFFHLMEHRGYDLDVTYVQSHAETIELLLSEKVDTIINLDMSVNSKVLDYLTTVDRIPFYFASTKGNVDLMAQLDDAIEKVEILEPDIHHRLLEKYFGITYEGDFLFTEQELSAISQVQEFKVGFLRDVPPYQYVDKDGENAGISIDLLNKFEKIIGIPFGIYLYDDLQGLAEAIQTAEIDMIGTLSNNYTLAHSLGVTLTKPYTSAGVYQISSAKQNGAVTPLYHYVSGNIPFYKKEDLTMVWDIKSTLDDIEENGDLTVICDPYITDYYLSLYQYDNIEIRAVSNVLNEISFGFGKHIDESIIGMMNRAMGYLDHFEVDEIIFNHTSVKAEYTMMDMILENIILINIILLVIFIIVILSIQNTAKKFRELSRRDSLTHVFNSGYFHDYVDKKLEKNKTGALILIDIDYFKDVNDTYGHQTGDEIIKLLARNLEKISCENSIVARLGGDEFAIFLENVAEKTVLDEKARELLKSMADNKENIPITLSIGGVIFEKSLKYSELFKKADTILYEVKEKGRNGFSFENMM